MLKSVYELNRYQTLYFLNTFQNIAISLTETSRNHSVEDVTNLLEDMKQEKMNYAKNCQEEKKRNKDKS